MNLSMIHINDNIKAKCKKLKKNLKKKIFIYYLIFIFFIKKKLECTIFKF